MYFNNFISISLHSRRHFLTVQCTRPLSFKHIYDNVMQINRNRKYPLPLHTSRSFSSCGESNVDYKIDFLKTTVGWRKSGKQRLVALSGRTTVCSRVLLISTNVSSKCIVSVLKKFRRLYSNLQENFFTMCVSML